MTSPPFPPSPKGEGGYFFKNQHGYTILEALLALMVVSLLSMPIYKLLTTEKLVSTSTRDQTTAYFLASSEMERIRTTPTEGLSNNEVSIEMNGKSYRMVRKVHGRFDTFGVVQDSLSNTMKEISVEVYLHEKRLSRLTGLIGGLDKEPPK